MSEQWRRAMRVAFAWVALAGGVAQAVAQESPQTVPVEVSREIEQAVELLDAWGGAGEELLRARAIVDRVLRTHPDYAPAYRAEAGIVMAEGFRYGSVYEPGTLEAAARSVDRAISLAPADPKNHLLRAEVHRLSRQWEEGEASLRKAEQAGAEPAWLAIRRGNLLDDQDRHVEAVAEYQKVLGSRQATKAERAAAENKMLPHYNRAGRLDDAERVYKTRLADHPGSAWLRGDYASWLLCWREDVDAALLQVRQARSVMDYGIARRTETAALYDRWSAHVLAGRQSQAEEAWRQSQVLADGGASDPALVLKDVCGGPVVHRALQAMQMSGKGFRIGPADAVMLAADRAPEAVPGIFVMRVQASGRSGNGLYLNSEKDYRDQRNLSVHLLPKAQEELRRLYRQEPDTLFNGMVIQVVGHAQRAKIDFVANGKPTGSFYYQTHVVVGSADKIDVLENVPSR